MPSPTTPDVDFSAQPGSSRPDGAPSQPAQGNSLAASSEAFYTPEGPERNMETDEPDAESSDSSAAGVKAFIQAEVERAVGEEFSHIALVQIQALINTVATQQRRIDAVDAVVHRSGSSPIPRGMSTASAPIPRSMSTASEAVGQWVLAYVRSRMDRRDSQVNLQLQ
ncbi:hypothetical protein N7509_001334 [Penicillium cosmopolitanum]|uniref:Uncharacterized protein n=1 Tax=Penicillium cosmopolitanum TaxID=1131564 RepID=A0A9X0BEY7_9EURO|nr:uncharacterized protein N7509_001334 [Penicillium cosmopolitanum]KAJ5414707.1 hypothetical protein N7509_001334 [Penicillium cosmopolitanum]